MKRVLGLIAAVLVMTGLGCACSKERRADDGAGPGADKPAPKYLIGFAQSTFEDPWRINMNQEIAEAAARRPEIKLVIANGENRNAKQIADVENFITQGVDVLVISPREAAPLTEAVARAYDAGIPVIVLDRRVLGEKYTCFIGASNLEIGRAAGEYVKGLRPEGGKVVEIEGILGATPTQERHQGFREIFEDLPQFEFVYSQPGDYKRSPAKQIMDNALQAHKRIDIVYAHNDEMAIGAYLAAEAVGRQGGIVFVGIDGQSEAVRMVRDGKLHATFVYPNGGREAIEAALKILAGETVVKEISLPATRITKHENLEYIGF